MAQTTTDRTPLGGTTTSVLDVEDGTYGYGPHYQAVPHPVTVIDPSRRPTV